MDNRKAYWDGWYAHKKANGLCMTCGKVEAEPGRTRCTECKIKRRKQAIKYEVLPKQEVKRRLRQQVIVFLGGACECCGEKTKEFLTLDHKNQNGSKERKTWQQIAMMRGILKGERTDIGLLCFNCNCGRELNGGICPHKQKLIPKRA